MTNKISLDVVNFKQELKRIENEISEIGEIELHERIDYAVDQLQIVTPVDTGEARKGWQKEKEQFRISKSLYEDVGTIKNPVEHIVYLNQGTSKQAPKYFIEQVLSRIGLITPN